MEVHQSAQFCHKCGTPLAADSRDGVYEVIAEADVRAVSAEPDQRLAELNAASDADKPAAAVTQRYAWGMVAVLILLSVPAPTILSPGTILVVGALLYLALFFLDASANNAELTLFRVMAVLLLPFLWLWIRGRALNTIRAPFWAYVGLFVLGILFPGIFVRGLSPGTVTSILFLIVSSLFVLALLLNVLHRRGILPQYISNRYVQIADAVHSFGSFDEKWAAGERQRLEQLRAERCQGEEQRLRGWRGAGQQ